MTHVGAFEAKTHLSSLLDQVAAGKEIIVTKHGKPVARLVPKEPEADQARAVIAKMRTLRANMVLGEDDSQQLSDEGRK